MAKPLSLFNGQPTPFSLSKTNPYLPSTHRPMMITMALTNSYWASIESDIEAHLKKSIPIRPPFAVFEPMHHLVFAAPKTNAPALCIAACELLGGHRAQAMAAACALHLVHSAAHTHHYLPLTDMPTPNPGLKDHHIYGPNIELLTGDGIMPFGFELLARSLNDTNPNNSDHVLRVIIEITRAIGSQGIIKGLYQELLQGTKFDEEWIERVCKKKEGQLNACGAACGAILGGGSEEEVEMLREYGLYVGMIDGMLNVEEENEKKMRETLERLRVMAIKELEGLKGRNVVRIYSLLHANPCHV